MWLFSHDVADQRPSKRKRSVMRSASALDQKGARHRTTKSRRTALAGTRGAALLLVVVAAAPGARADVLQWEYINPADPARGRQPSLTLAPDGAGAYAGPGAALANLNLTKAYLIGADLSPYVYDDGSYWRTHLVNVNLSQADLTNAKLGGESYYDFA